MFPYIPFKGAILSPHRLLRRTSVVRNNSLGRPKNQICDARKAELPDRGLIDGGGRGLIDGTAQERTGRDKEGALQKKFKACFIIVLRSNFNSRCFNSR